MLAGSVPRQASVRARVFQLTSRMETRGCCGDGRISTRDGYTPSPSLGATVGTRRARGNSMTNRTIPARVLIVVENLSVPTDRRVWKEAQALTRLGHSVTVVCPQGTKRDLDAHEQLDGIEIHRYRPREA